jgi:hypothetical protein
MCDGQSRSRSDGRKVCPPLSECPDDRKLFFLVYWVVQFGALECARVICNGVRFFVENAMGESIG